MALRGGSAIFFFFPSVFFSRLDEEKGRIKKYCIGNKIGNVVTRDLSRWRAHMIVFTESF